MGVVFVFKILLIHDRIGEVAFAVLMVIIINGYVALSDLNTGFVYIVAVNLGACLSWGTIDGLIYARLYGTQHPAQQTHNAEVKPQLRGHLERVKSNL